MMFDRARGLIEYKQGVFEMIMLGHGMSLMCIDDELDLARINEGPTVEAPDHQPTLGEIPEEVYEAAAANCEPADE